MARSGDVFEHPLTGERFVCRQVARDTGGELFQLDLYVQPGGFVAAEHIHPKQEERFEVLAGTLRLRSQGRERILGAGEAEVVAPRQPHVWWNAGAGELRVLVDFRPALRTEMFFETAFGLAKAGKTNRKGLPHPLQLAVLANEYSDEFQLAWPPLAVQRILVAPLAGLGRLLGYRAWYPQYVGAPAADRA
jgi:quercetin dioxygenase-like cupin family protein